MRCCPCREGESGYSLPPMRVLYHLPLDAACRETRIHIAEKGLECELKAEKVWERR